MARRSEHVKTLGKITGVNLEKRIATCATAMNTKVTANFYDSQSDLLTVPAVGEIWELSLTNNRWNLERRNDGESALSREYDKSRVSGNLNYKDTFLISDGVLRLQDKFGPLFDDGDPGKIHSSRIPGNIVSTTVVDARVVSFEENANIRIEWPINNPQHEGIGPGEQGISHIGAHVKAIIDGQNNVMWVSLPAQPLGENPPFYIGSGGQAMEELRANLDALDVELQNNLDALSDLNTDLAQNTLDLEQARRELNEAKANLETVRADIGTIEETVVIDRGRFTYSIFFPTVEDGAGKPVNAIWQVFSEETQDLLEAFMWDGAQWKKYGWGEEAISDLAITSAKIREVSAAKITSGFIDSARIRANSITADKLLIGSFDNYWHDVNFEDERGYGNPVENGMLVFAGLQVFDSDQFIFDIDPNEKYVISFTKQGVGSISLRTRALAGGTTWTTLSTYEVGTQEQGRFTFQVTPYPDVTKLRFQFETYTRYNPVYISNITVYKLVSGTRIENGAITTDKIYANAITSDKIASESIVSAHIGAGQIVANHIAAGEIATEHLGANTVTAEKVAAGAITSTEIAAETITAENLAIGSVTADKLNVVYQDPATGYGMTLQPEGLQLLDVEGQPAVSLRTDSEQYFGVTRDGSFLASISPDGEVTSQTVHASNSLTYKGEELQELLDYRPRGILARAAMQSGHITVGTGHSRLMMCSFQSPPDNRMIRLTIRVPLSTTGGGYLCIKQTTSNVVDNTNSVFYGWYMPSRQAGYLTANKEITLSSLDLKTEGGWSWPPDSQITIGVFFYMFEAGKTAVVTGTYGASMIIEDVGPAVPEQITPPYVPPTGGGTGTGDNTTPAKVRKTTTWSATDWYTFGNGSYRHTKADTHIVQGYIAGVTSRSHIYFDHGAIRTALGGADIIKTEVYLSNAHWGQGAGGIANIWRHNYSARASDYGSTATLATSRMSRGESKWITVPNSFAESLKSGTMKGFALNPSNTSLEQYGYFNFSSDKPKIRITYEK